MAFIQANQIEFVQFAINEQTAFLHLRNYDDFFKNQIKIYQLRESFSLRASKLMDTLLFFHNHLNEIQANVELMKISEAVCLAKRVENNIEEYQPYITYWHGLYLHMAIAYFIADDFKSCLKWLLRIMNELKSFMREDVQSMARLLFVLIHYELGNEFNLSAYAQSSARYLAKKDKLNRPEEAILSFFKREKAYVLLDRSTLLSNFKSIVDSLNTIINDPKEQQLFRYFDFVSWFESKINGTSFRSEIEKKRSALSLTNK